MVSTINTDAAMFLLRSLMVGALLAGLPGTSALALDPLHTEIITLRLGMTEAEIANQLAIQGYKTTPDGPGVQARTRDGFLRVVFSPDGRARRIAYTFNGRGLNEGAILRAAMVDHYGRPSVAEPLSWCASPAASGSCSPDQPVLTFGPGKDGKVVLTLAMSAAP
jgi:hypothetical protein